MSHTQVVALQAKVFLEAYETLDNSMYRKVQQGDLHFKVPIPERIPIVTAAITCIAFATEIAIKALIVHSASGNLAACPKNMHDLGELFKKVPDGLRAVIAKELKKSLPEVEENLEKNAKAFVKWRYSYESGAWADEKFLHSFVKVALAQINNS